MHPSIPLIILIGGLNPTDVALSSEVEMDQFVSARIDYHYPHATPGVHWHARLKPEFETQIKYPSAKVVQVAICEREMVRFTRTMMNTFPERSIWFMAPDSFRVQPQDILFLTPDIVGQAD